MIKVENIKIYGWEEAIRGMRNPKNSWDRMDSRFDLDCDRLSCYQCPAREEELCMDMLKLASCDIGPNDRKLMMQLAKGGPVHAKYRRMITVYMDITAPLYWWKEFDTYKVGTVANSCSTMHKIDAKEFTLDDFSHEKLSYRSIHILGDTIDILNDYRKAFVDYKEGDMYIENDGRIMSKKDLWHQMIQLLPTSYNQRRTVMMNYEVLANIYKWRHDHKLDEWVELCKIIETLPYSGIITGKFEQSK